MIDKISVIIITNKLNEKKKKPNKQQQLKNHQWMMICMGFKGGCVEKAICLWMIVGSGEWVVAYVKVGRFILFFMTTLITITRQSPNTTTTTIIFRTLKYLIVKKKEFLSSRSTPLHFLFLSLTSPLNWLLLQLLFP